MESLLTVGALTQILEGEKPAYPVFQVIGYKPMPPDSTSYGETYEGLRYRVMLGDGVRTHQYCIIANQDLVQELKTGKIEKWSIIKVLSYQTHDLESVAEASKKRMIYILNLEVVKKGLEVGRKLNVESAPTAQPEVANGNRNGHVQQQMPTSVPQPVKQESNSNRSGYGAEPTQPQPYPMPHQTTGSIGRSPRPMKSSHDNQIINIGELSPYVGKWIIKGRVTSKGPIREYNNAKGGGKVFSFVMADRTGEIKVTAFNTDLERVAPYVERNKVYILSRGQVKSADKRYTTADFEITIGNETLLEEVPDSDGASDIPLANFNFISIASLQDQLPTLPVDLIGAITSISELTTIMSKNKNKELKKRNITIVDMSRATISVTLWEETGENFEGQVGDIFVNKGARIGSYGGKSASAGDSIYINPEIPEVRRIKNWYSNLIDQNFTNLTSSSESVTSDQWRCLALLNDMQKMKALISGAPQYSKCKAMLMSIGRNPVYKCCLTEGCGKKLADTQGGDMSCSKCGQTFTQAKYRYKTDVEIEDYSSSSWVTLWDDKAESLFGMKPEELERHMKMDNKEMYERVLTKQNFSPFVFTLRSKIDVYNNEERVKHTVVSLTPLDPVTHAKQVISEIKLLAS